MKKILYLTIAFVLLTGINISAQTKVSSFSNLKTLTVANSILVHYRETGVEIINKTCSKLPVSDPFYAAFSDEYSDNIVILKMKIGSNDSDKLTVLFSEGPSGDPSFIFARANGEEIAWLGGTEIFLPGTGSVYTTGHTNTSFNKKSKYTFKGSEFIETRQAYYYVGLNTVTTKTIQLFADREQTVVVATLPAGSEVEVLITDYHQDFGGKETFLLRTPFGLTGWFSVNTYNLGEEPPIKGIFFAGD